MFSIYRRFNGDVLPKGGINEVRTKSENRVTLAENGQRQNTNILAQRASGMPKMHGQDMSYQKNMGQINREKAGNAVAKDPRIGINHCQNPYLNGQQKALPPPISERDQHQRKNHSPRAKQKNFGFLQGILPSGIYDSESKKLFGFLAAEDLLLVALIFLMLEKDGEDNVLIVLALIYVLLSDYIDLPELGF